MRLLALAHCKDGHSRTQIAKFVKVSRASVNKWVQTFLEEGLEGLQEKPRTGRPAFLNAEQREQLSQYHQAPTLFSRAKPDRTSVEWVKTTLSHLLRITKALSPKYVGLGRVFWNVRPESDRCAREDR
ncbi:helix-turn-helix domain-containing protein [Vibrio vulnificus]|nr:helix-turn-helix domain-containing protein [Vibrio vulnificus]MDK2602519.1 helix-turn-helix domain-containing protein [Vibrio vulnificus]MDK2719068.1 helix-turn-helix domain-containing protein [Vibrio vulnificus]